MRDRRRPMRPSIADTPAPSQRVLVAAAAALAAALASSVSAAHVESSCSANGGHCSTDSPSARILSAGSGGSTRARRRLLAYVEGRLKRLLMLRETEDGTVGVFTRKKVRSGEVLLRLPLSEAIWRGTLNLQDVSAQPLSNAPPVSDSDEFLLWLAAARRRTKVGKSVGKFQAYAEALLETRVPIESVLMWSLDELQWLDGTEAGDLATHLLSRAAHVLSAAPLAADMDDVRVASAHLYTHVFRIWLGDSKLSPHRAEDALLPGIDLCRAREGGLKPHYDSASGKILLVAREPLSKGTEVFVDFGPRDRTDALVGLGKAGSMSDGIFLPVALEGDLNGDQKAKLLEHLRWPGEVRLVNGEVRDFRALRLASMPPEEFSSWSVGALVADAPLAVSRAFRTEVLGAVFLVSECSKRHRYAVAGPALLSSTGLSERFQLAKSYREYLLDSYSKCRSWAQERLNRLRAWALRQDPFILAYIDREVAHGSRSSLESSPKHFQHSELKPAFGELADVDVDVLMTYATIAALVNAKAPEFVPYFSELLRLGNVVNVPGFEAPLRRLRQIQQLAVHIVHLKSPACGSVDLSAFEWINELHGVDQVFTTLRLLLPEMAELVREFAELENVGAVASVKPT